MKELQKYARKLKLPFIEDEYDTDLWFDVTEGLEESPEQGPRCSICFQTRLRKTAEYCRTHDFENFATTLTISPHKRAFTINKIGKSLAKAFGLNFHEADWKKDGGFEKSCEISKKNRFYRQKYCGCVYSRRNALKKINPQKEVEATRRQRSLA